MSSAAPPACSAPSSSALPAPTSSRTSTPPRRPRATASTCSARPAPTCRRSGASPSRRASPTCSPSTHEPLADLVDEDGVRHTVWRIDDPATMRRHLRGGRPSSRWSIADGHHRYETSLAYKAEREAADDDPAGAAATLAYVVELVEDELTVHAIHRLISGLPEDFDFLAALAPWFEDVGPPPEGTSITTALVDQGCIAIVHARRRAAPAPASRRAGRGARPRHEPARRRAGRAPRPRPPLPARRRQRPRRGGARRGPGRRPPATGHRRPDRGHRPRRRAHAPEDHVLPPQAQDGPGLPQPRLATEES